MGETMSTGASTRMRETPETANDRFKHAFGHWLWGSMIAATALHFLVFQLWPDMVAADFSHAMDELTAIELPPEVELPPPPERISRPAMPVVATTDIDVEATIDRTTFDHFAPEELPPPSGVTTTPIEEAPGFAVMTVRPRVLNVPEVRRTMEQQYPSVLRDARIGGTVVVWFLVDERGEVEDTQIQTSSGQPLLDQAALRVASVYRFSPARNRDQLVKVWVIFPVTFQVEPRGSTSR
jgi:TonB family protein